MHSNAAEAGHPAQRTAVFTIVSRNYFHFAVNLMASVALHLPGTRRVVAICDDTEGLQSPDPDIEIVGVEDLGMPALDRMAVYYTILELNTAIKPSVFRWLLQDQSLDKVVYFDPDIQLYSTGEPLLRRLDDVDVVLTPHITAPLQDEHHPSDLQILQSGTYNLGFLALRRSPDSERLLLWWQGKLERDCVVDIPRGLFTDQKWMDLVPGFFERAHVERNPGWNVAYWNLMHRQVEVQEDAYTVNGEPLFFFHFSGHDPRSGSISKHQDRYAMAGCSPAVRQLFARYTEQLARAGRERWAAFPYAYAKLADGTALPDCARRVLRQQLDGGLAAMPPLRSLEGAQWLIDFLTAPVDDRQPPISRLAYQLYQDRVDLQNAFPDMLGSRREAYLGWFGERAGPEAGVLGPMATMRGTASTPNRLPQPSDAGAATSAAPSLALSAPGPSRAAPAASMAAPPTGAVLPYRMAYRLAWKARNVLRPMTSLEFRARMRTALLNRAYPVQASIAPLLPAGAGPRPEDAGRSRPAGVTVIGYVKAESGVGEAARATLRALATTDIPHSLIDYRTGNVSRMGEMVDEALASGLQHAVSLLHINADQLPLARTFLGEEPFTSTYRIGYWNWELENFPAQWHGAFGHVDEVWVPSTFCQRAIAAVSPVPVLVMPLSVDVPAESRPDRSRFGLPNDAVVFLAMADMMSIAGRKNPFAAVEAFAAAFGHTARGHTPEVLMVVKIANPDRDAAAHARLQALAASCPGIRLFGESLDRPALNTLLDSIDCFVSLHRSEGYGLVIAEAMARGKVVIATGWSGNMDFMSTANSLPVDYCLVTLDTDHGPYARGERWAEPDLHDAAAKLRLVAGDATLRQRLGARARQDCAAQLSPAVVGAAQSARLRWMLQERVGTG